MSDVRLCVVGAGSLSTRRIYPCIGAAGAELVGVCDLDEEKAATNARRFGGRAYTDMNPMLDRESPDGVIICIGPAQHAQLAPPILRRGIPVYTEKPPALTAAAALAVAQVSLETGVLCTTAFKKRYNAAYTRAREWIETFDPSDLYALSVDYASAQFANESPETMFLLDFAIHAFDLVGYLMGDVDRVFCFARGRDAYAVSLRFRSGAVGSMSLNDGRSFSVPTEEVEITARGGNFMSIHNSSCWRITADGKPCEWREPPTFTSAGDSGNDTGHLAEIVDFVAAIRENRTTRSNIYESYKSLVLYEAVKSSAETHRVVPVRYQAL
ncbi:MAG TPA: Gfo/Idh/MocA family oxidoreductase [Phycisphaerae bacterium]|nr:Gfo/Idh/MocA family oxidoreductase [Phycisphaerae bacterium]